MIDAPGRLHLPRREAGRRVTGRALQCLRIEPAATRIADEAVHQTVFGVALGEHRTGEERDLGDGERRRVDRLLVPDEAGHRAHPVEGGSAGDDAIEVGRVPFGFLHGLAPAVGAAFEVGQPFGLAVEGVKDFLAGHRHDVHRAVTEVDLAHEVVQCPRAVEGRRERAVADVTGVGADDGIPAGEGAGRARNAADEAAAAGVVELAVPRRRRQPQLEVDLRVDVADDETVLGCGAQSRDDRGGGDGRVRDRNARERGARHAGGVSRQRGQRERGDERQGHAEEERAVCHGTPLRCG